MERRTPLVKWSGADISAAVQQVLPGATVSASRLVDHGLANTNYLVDTDHGAFVLRLHARDPSLRGKEGALLRLLATSVPVPALIGHGVHGIDHLAFSLLQRLPGKPLIELVRGASEAALSKAAGQLGGVVARLTTIRFDRFGDLAAEAPDAPLEVRPFGFDDFYRHCLFETRAAERLGPRAREIWELVQRARERLRDERPLHLVHGDFNPTNILVDDDGEVTGVLDWEFAHAGSLWADLGNLLRERPECPLPPAFAEAVAAGLREGGVDLPDDWRDHALFHDLSSACERLSSPHPRPQVEARALEQIDRTVARLSKVLRRTASRGRR